MLEELKKMNKQYYDEYEENDCDINHSNKEIRIPVNGEIHKETKIQQLMFKIIIFVAVFLTSLGIVVLSKVNNRNSEGIVSAETNELRDTLTNESAKNKELIEKKQRKQKELESLKGKLTEKNDIAEEKKKEVLENNVKLGLRKAGAEAISINDQRVIATTPISCIGTVIKINDEKIGGPYVIRAIGHSDYLKTALEIPGGILRILESSRNRC